jgi:hypothetical protein
MREIKKKEERERSLDGERVEGRERDGDKENE